MPRLRRSIASRSFCEVEAELFGNGLADHHGAEALQVRDALEVEDPLDELVGVLHLADRLVAVVLAEAFVAPVVAHLGVDEVLVDRRQLGREDLVEQLDDTRTAAHDRTSRRYPAGQNGGQATATAAVSSRDVLAHEAFERAVTATAVSAGPAPLADGGDVVRTREHRGPHGLVVDGFAVADDHEGSVRSWASVEKVRLVLTRSVRCCRSDLRRTRQPVPTRRAFAWASRQICETVNTCSWVEQRAGEVALAPACGLARRSRASRASSPSTTVTVCSTWRTSRKPSVPTTVKRTSPHAGASPFGVK